MIENVRIEDLESEKQTLISILVDESGSMSSYTKAMKECLNSFKDAIVNSKEVDSILVSKTNFSESVYTGGFVAPCLFETNYSANGGTALYDAIVVAEKKIGGNDNRGYMDELRNSGIRTKGVVAIFSDGEDTSSSATLEEAKEAIRRMQNNDNGITVAFIAFGNGAESIANDLGIKSTNVLDVSASVSELRRAFNVLSNSAISFSKKADVGDENFFQLD